MVIIPFWKQSQHWHGGSRFDQRLSCEPVDHKRSHEPLETLPVDPGFAKRSASLRAGGVEKGQSD